MNPVFIFVIYLFILLLQHLNNTYDCDVPLVLMNSFNTEEDTQKVLRKYKGFRIKIHTFTQSKYDDYIKI